MDLIERNKQVEKTNFRWLINFQGNCNIREYPSGLSARFNSWLFWSQNKRKFDADLSAETESKT